MFKILRAAFAIAAAILVALCVPAGIFWDMLAVWCMAGGALLFFVLSMLFKFLQEEREGNSPSSAKEDAAQSGPQENAPAQSEPTDTKDEEK